jgi:predicted PurR-regulated permease PerM
VSLPPEPLPEDGPGSLGRRRGFLISSALLLITVLFVFRGVLLPFILAVVLAYVLAPLVTWGEKLRFGSRSAPRWSVVLSIYMVLLGSLGLGGWVLAPPLSAEVQRLAQEGPRLLLQVRHEWLPEIERRLHEASAPYMHAGTEPAAADEAVAGEGVPGPTPQQLAALRVRPAADGSFEVLLPKNGLQIVPAADGSFRVLAEPPRKAQRADDVIMEAARSVLEGSEQTAVSVLKTAQQVIAALTRGVFTFVMMLMLSAYMLITSDRIFDFCRSLYRPSKRDNFDELLRRVNRGLGGVVRGQLIICCVNGVLSAALFTIVGLKYWAFMSILAGVMSIVPIFGSILSTIPAVAVALPDGPAKALAVLIGIVGIHQLEANFLNPKIMGDAARVHPVLVVFALLGGEHIAGITGALLAVPVLSITQTLFLYLRERYLGVPRVSSMVPVPPAPAPSSHGSIPGEANPTR